MNTARRMGASLNRAVLDAATVDDLFADLAACTTVHEVLVKGAAHHPAEAGTCPLDEACRLVQEGRVRGVQIRYRWQDQEWCDTLLVTDRGVRLVRIGGADLAGGADGP